MIVVGVLAAVLARCCEVTTSSSPGATKLFSRLPNRPAEHRPRLADYGTVFCADEHRRLADAFHRLPCPAPMAVGRPALTLELYGADVIGEYVRRYNVNVRGRMSSTNVHLVVGHRL